MNACKRVLLEAPVSPFCDPSVCIGRNGAPVFLEIGAGKGGFAVEMLNEDVHVGDSFEFGPLYVEVSEMAGSIVERLFILVKEDEDEDEAND